LPFPGRPVLRGSSRTFTPLPNRRCKSPGQGDRAEFTSPRARPLLDRGHWPFADLLEVDARSLYSPRPLHEPEHRIGRLGDCSVATSFSAALPGRIWARLAGTIQVTLAPGIPAPAAIGRSRSRGGTAEARAMAFSSRRAPRRGSRASTSSARERRRSYFGLGFVGEMGHGSSAARCCLLPFRGLQAQRTLLGAREVRRASTAAGNTNLTVSNAAPVVREQFKWRNSRTVRASGTVMIGDRDPLHHAVWSRGPRGLSSSRRRSRRSPPSIDARSGRRDSPGQPLALRRFPGASGSIECRGSVCWRRREVHGTGRQQRETLAESFRVQLLLAQRVGARSGEF